MLMILFNILTGRFVCGLSAAALPYQNNCRIRHKFTWRICGAVPADSPGREAKTQGNRQGQKTRCKNERNLVK
jgi:hypothetical protein